MDPISWVFFSILHAISEEKLSELVKIQLNREFPGKFNLKENFLSNSNNSLENQFILLIEKKLSAVKKTR